jgi:hypothetical protein
MLLLPCATHPRTLKTQPMGAQGHAFGWALTAEVQAVAGFVGGFSVE